MHVGAVYTMHFMAPTRYQKKAALSSLSNTTQFAGLKSSRFAKQHLDNAAPLVTGKHADVKRYFIDAGELTMQLTNGENTALVQADKFVGYKGNTDAPSAVLLENNALHIEIQIDPSSVIGNTDKAGVKDLLVEAAVTTIMDCEDSVAAVDAEDKVEVYRNWLGLMQGNLSASLSKNGKKNRQRVK